MAIKQTFGSLIHVKLSIINVTEIGYSRMYLAIMNMHLLCSIGQLNQTASRWKAFGFNPGPRWTRINLRQHWQFLTNVWWTLDPPSPTRTKDKPTDGLTFAYDEPARALTARGRGTSYKSPGTSNWNEGNFEEGLHEQTRSPKVLSVTVTLVRY